MKNLFDCCLIVNVKSDPKTSNTPIKRGVVRQNLFDCCLIGCRNSIERLGSDA